MLHRTHKVLVPRLVQGLQLCNGRGKWRPFGEEQNDEEEDEGVGDGGDQKQQAQIGSGGGMIGGSRGRESNVMF